MTEPILSASQIHAWNLCDMYWGPDDFVTARPKDGCAIDPSHCMGGVSATDADGFAVRPLYDSPPRWPKGIAEKPPTTTYRTIPQSREERPRGTPPPRPHIRIRVCPEPKWWGDGWCYRLDFKLGHYHGEGFADSLSAADAATTHLRLLRAGKQVR